MPTASSPVPAAADTNENLPWNGTLDQAKGDQGLALGITHASVHMPIVRSSRHTLHSSKYQIAGLVLKAKVFIGSSAEAVSIADAIHSNLTFHAECTVWKHAFHPTHHTLFELLRNLHQSDFGIFVLSPDDLTTMRHVANAVARDNVIFELGMFIGRLGSERTFFLVPDQFKMHLPSDLAGVTPIAYESERQDGNLLAALNPACLQVRMAIERMKSLQDSAVAAETETASARTDISRDHSTGITIEPYKKSFLIKGDTKPLSERLKAFASWNRSLDAWVLPRTKIEKFRQEFSDLIKE